MKSLISLYSRLSNRVIALLVLLVVLPLFGYGLYFVFGLNVGSLDFQISGGSPVLVAVKKGEVSAFERECDGLCHIENIPAGTYSIVYSGSGIIETKDEITVRRGDHLVKSFTPEGKIILDPIDREATATGTTEDDDTVYAGEFHGKRYSVTDKPFALYDTTGSGTKLYEAKGVIAYLTGSVQYGYFLAITADKSVHAVDLTNLATHDFSLPQDEAIRSLKPVGKPGLAVAETNKKSYLVDFGNDSVSELALYDDLAISSGGTLVGLVRAGSDQKRALLNVSNRSGDVLMDATDATKKRVLLDGLDHAAHILSVGNHIVVEYESGERANINGIK